MAMQQNCHANDSNRRRKRAFEARVQFQYLRYVQTIPNDRYSADNEDKFTLSESAGILAVEMANDQPTMDLLTQRLNVHEKTIGMLRSLLEENLG